MLMSAPPPPLSPGPSRTGGFSDPLGGYGLRDGGAVMPLLFPGELCQHGQHAACVALVHHRPLKLDPVDLALRAVALCGQVRSYAVHPQ